VPFRCLCLLLLTATTIPAIRGKKPPKMATISTYISDFLSGHLDPRPIHFVLIGATIIAEIAVAIGILLEAPKDKKLREIIGMILVLGGCLSRSRIYDKLVRI
jgi:hypothetical protein